ncbi:MAG TPA: Hsp20/alpha crystallin family protein [Chitinophagales bacterium]|nr:Hsp20/alpha crystallin family protein [Chitinophagales bacterium]MBP6155006.1 Hsp20/alpha crystallin family protein [Chitinophagales bacterium]HQV77127.1 Hsp20/alpha crystallin family protein [Chitinophagales bacterium]HQW77807.1 Hsp20/alpha crystallin family protein [Chitinophagales bacterium]HRB18638.1 Hsp20/alpha crystallin family protein [Chitinophagales bacterium]
MRTLVKSTCGTPTTNRFFFDDFFSKEFGFAPAAFSKTTPAVNVREEEKQFLVEVAAPGLQKEHFKIEVNDGILSISAEQKTEKTDESDGTTFTRKEFSYTSFKRSFTLDAEALDVDNIAAKYENGILAISIPKKEKEEAVKQVKSITIS